jgi:outer membrane protein assembly factor BamB
MQLRRLATSTILLVGLLIAITVARGDSNWPRWRGPQQNGHTSETDWPVKWSAENLLWKTQLPGIGQSSPIIWGDRIFLTSYLDKGKERLVFCVDRKTGKILWQQTAWKGEPEKSHVMNGWASASCVTDGEIVVAFFGLGGIHAYTLDGKPLWSRDLGKFEGPWGTAACPIIVDNLVIQNCDADTDACLVALDKKTGREVWRTKRRDYRGWGSPILINTGKRRELVINGHEGVQAYDPATGKELWFCASTVGRGEPTPTPAGGGLFIVNGLKGGDVYIVRPGGSGDVSSTHKSWSAPRRGARDTPSPIVIGDYIIATDMDGVFTCYSAADGHEYWKSRLEGKYSGSPFAASGLVYFLNEDGKTFVIKPGPKLEVVAENSLPANKDEIFRASLTPCDGQLFARSTTVLYCIGM